MSAAASMSGSDGEVSEHGMSDGTIDQFLTALGSAVRDFLQMSENEERRRDELNEAGEAYLERRDKAQPTILDCQMAISSIRQRLAIDSATYHRRVARELASWWVDAAVVALAAASSGIPVTTVRMGAGNPVLPMDEEEVAQLPLIDEQTRRIVELAARLGSAPLSMRSEGGDDDLMAEAVDLASRHGLIVDRDAGGEVKITEDIWPEARRRRLWDDFWIEHHIPRIPHMEELTALLMGTADATIQRLRATTQAVARAVAGELRIKELSDAPGKWAAKDEEEFHRLCEQADGLTALLATYAQIITESLPEVRAAACRQRNALDRPAKAGDDPHS